MVVSNSSLSDHVTPTTMTVLACLVCAVALAYLATFVTESRPLQFGVIVGVGVVVPRLLTAPLRLPG